MTDASGQMSVVLRQAAGLGIRWWASLEPALAGDIEVVAEELLERDARDSLETCDLD